MCGRQSYVVVKEGPEGRVPPENIKNDVVCARFRRGTPVYLQAAALINAIVDEG